MQTDAQPVVLEKLRELTVYPERMCGGATEIYYDARISGDDLWELVTTLAERFATDAHCSADAAIQRHFAGRVCSTFTQSGC